MVLHILLRMDSKKSEKRQNLDLDYSFKRGDQSRCSDLHHIRITVYLPAASI